MSLFKRINDNIRANLNALLDKAEDPVKLSNQYLLDMEEDIADAQGAVARQLVVVRKFTAQYHDAENMVEKRDAQAIEALQKGREDLARRALEDKKIHIARAELLKQEYEKSQNIADTLKAQLKEMQEEYKDLQAKRDMLLARVQTARAQQEVYGLKAGFPKDDARQGLERMQHKVMHMEAEAEVATTIGVNISLDEELAALGDNDIDRQLEELKQKLELEKSRPE